MAQLGNTPNDTVTLRLQARKSFSLGLWIQDRAKHPMDIAGATFRIVMRPANRIPLSSDDASNLITNDLGVLVSPGLGFLRFNLQASDLDHKPGEYNFDIVMISGGYSSVIVQGVVELEQNTEFSSTAETYEGSEATSSSLAVHLKGSHSIHVTAGPTLAPGEVLFTSDMEHKLLQLYASRVAEDSLLTADDIVDGNDKVMMTAAERYQLANLTIEWDNIPGRPTFGTAAFHNHEEYLRPDNVDGSDVTSGQVSEARLPILLELRGVGHGPVLPTGTPNMLFFRHIS